MKRLVLLIISALICGVAFVSCNADMADLTDSMEGTFTGTYTVTHLSSDSIVNGIMTVKLKNGKFSLAGFLHKQAEFSGNYSISDDTIKFSIKVWKTDYSKNGMIIMYDFDSRLIPQGEYNFTFNGRELKFSRTEEGFAYYEWKLEKIKN